MRAIQLALKEVSYSGHRDFLVISDSLSALLALLSRDISHPFLIDIHDTYTQLISKGKKIIFMWIPSHVGIVGNDIVDRAAKNALGLKLPRVPFQMVPHTDFRKYISKYCSKLWQQEWSVLTKNKLHKVCPDLCDPLPSQVQNRKQESVLSRLHIGHTYLTHGFLLRREDPPWCNTCNVRLSVRHILTNCLDFAGVRDRFYSQRTLKDIFRNVPSGTLCTFLYDIHLYNKI